MATSKPPLLTTQFFRAVRSCRPQTYRSIRNQNVSAVHRNQLHTSSRRLQQGPDYQRYGPAATPSMPPPPKPSEPYLPSTEQTKKDASPTELKKTERKKKEAKEKEEEKQASEAQEQQSQQEKMPEEKAVEGESAQEAQQEEVQASGNKAEEPEASQKQEQITSMDEDGPLPNRELDIVLSVPTPTEVKSDSAAASEEHVHPHLEASPYEHHFDTYTLVQDLCKEEPNPNDPEAAPEDSFTDEQAVTLMKAIRLMLAENLDLAKDGLVSKSDTENETYLFRAACSELKTAMQTSRFVEAQKQRSQRAQVQHEFDILNQKVSQDIMTMREELKGMFNDRKLHLQEEKRQVDGKIQSLSYRISVDLNSEAKSEVEGLRWVLTRRAALAIGAAASMVLAFLQYWSVRAREQAEIDKKRKAAQRAQDERLKREKERFASSGNSTGRSGTQSEGIVLGGTAGSGNFEESLG